jgi:hypothetical protein
MGVTLVFVKGNNVHEKKLSRVVFNVLPNFGFSIQLALGFFSFKVLIKIKRFSLVRINLLSSLKDLNIIHFSMCHKFTWASRVSRGCSEFETQS